MDVFEAHKYLDPTTHDDSSFLSFSSFADLTHSPYDQFLAPSASSSSARSPLNHKHQPSSYQQRQSIHPQHLQSQTLGLYQSFDLVSQPPTFSSPRPGSSHSDSGSESPSTPSHVVSCGASSSSYTYTPRTPTGHDFGIFHTPSSSPLINRGGPSRYSAPTTTPSHHVSHRSASSSSDWNSPVTPSLTYKSSVESLASFAPEPDFFLPPPSTHTAFGWDDQSLGSSSSLTIRSSHSPPSPSPHRVASNPTLGKNRHPRSITQVKSLPSLREEGPVSMESNFEYDELFKQFINTENVGLDTSAKEYNPFTNGASTGDLFGGDLGSLDGIDFTALLDSSWPHESSSVSGGSSSSGTMPGSEQTISVETFDLHDSFAMLSADSTSMANAPSLVPDLSSTSTVRTAADLNIYGWQPENDQAEEVQYSNGQSGSTFNAGTQYPTTQSGQVYRPVTAPQAATASRQVSESYSLAVPAPNMARSVSTSAVVSAKCNNVNYSYNGQQQVLSDPLVQYASFNDPASAIDPALMGMSSTKPADLPSPEMINSRRSSHSLGTDIEAAAQYAMYQQQGQYPAGPMTAPFVMQSQAGYSSVHPMNIQPQSSHVMKRVGSQPLPGPRGQAGGHPINYHPGQWSTTTQHPEIVRQQTRAEVPSRRVSMEEASVMQPWIPTPVPQILLAYQPNGQQPAPQQYQQLQQQQQMQSQQPQFIGWESPNSAAPSTQYAPQVQRTVSMGSGPVMTHAYASHGNVHPPANSFHPNPNPHSGMQSAPVPHRVHPPPHPGSVASGSGSGPVQQQRTIARLPAGRQPRKANGSGTPKAKTPKTPGRKKNLPVNGISEHGGTYFANYGTEDGQTLLRGVAPSGSQSKRKREAEAASTSGVQLASVAMAQSLSASDVSGDEDARSKRSRSSASGSGSNAQ